MKEYDLIVIGTGGASIVADAAVKAGKKVAVVERGKFGGTCLNRGCIPTKVLATAADLVREIGEAERIGVNTTGVQMDWPKISRRVWDKIGENAGVRDYFEKLDGVDVYGGTAAFTDKKTVRVTFEDGTPAEELTADNILIGTGAKTNVPDVPGLQETGFITSESFFGESYPDRPYQSLIIIGGGAIGCEFAHIFAAAGSRVTVVQRNVRLLPKEDEEISAQLLREFTLNGIRVLLEQVTVSVRQENGMKILTTRHKKTGEVTETAAEEILVAPGISPMTELLHLENTDVALDERGYIRTNEFLETTADGIYAVGDVNGKAPFRHKANYEADVLAHNLYREKDPAKWRWAAYGLIPAVTYTWPQAAHVGLTEEQAKKAGFTVKTGKNHYSASAKGYAMGYLPGAPDDGFIKLVGDEKTGRILGAHIIGPQASLLLQPFINLMSSGTLTLSVIEPDIASETVKALRGQGMKRTLDPNLVEAVGEMVVPHPSLAEAVMWTQDYYEHRW